MEQALADLIECNQLEEIDTDLYTGRTSHPNRSRIYGGQVLAQALSAAQRTVGEGYALHSMHSYFLRMGDPSHLVVYEVERIRDGRSFTTRRVVAKQYGKAIFTAALSFQREEAGFEHARPMPDVPTPEQLKNEEELLRAFIPDSSYGWPIEFRPVDPIDHHNTQAMEPAFCTWFRTKDRIGDDLPTHQQLLAYASDNPILVTALRPHARSYMDPDIAAITLDHTLWFYRPFRVDDWLLYEVHSDVAGGGRALSRGRIYNRGGELVAVVAQEGLLRDRRAQKSD